MPRPPAELRRINDEARRRARAHRRLLWERRRRVALWFVAGLAVLAAVAFVVRFGGVSIG
jgi:lipopolysaccharide export LptBFGC system permease protein LptF